MLYGLAQQQKLHVRVLPCLLARIHNLESNDGQTARLIASS